MGEGSVVSEYYWENKNNSTAISSLVKQIVGLAMFERQVR